MVKRRNVVFRATDKLHKMLTETAASSGMSISELIERTMERSLAESDLFARLEPAIRAAVMGAIEEVGMGTFRSMSIFGSNHKAPAPDPQNGYVPDHYVG